MQVPIERNQHLERMQLPIEHKTNMDTCTNKEFDSHDEAVDVRNIKKAQLGKQAIIADQNLISSSNYRVNSENNSKGALPIPQEECPSHITSYEIVPMDGTKILHSVQLIFTVPSDESLPYMSLPMSNITIEAPKPADAIQLKVDTSHLAQNIDWSSFEIDGEAVRENEEVESGSCRFEAEG